MDIHLGGNIHLQEVRAEYLSREVRAETWERYRSGGQNLELRLKSDVGRVTECDAGPSGTAE